MKIFIDSGHNNSGADTGAVGNGIREQDINFYVSEKLGNILKSRGIEIKYSRPTIETNVGNTVSESLNIRCQMANDFGADYFVSIHCNAAEAESANGTETYCYKTGTIGEKLSKLVNNEIVNGVGTTNRGVKTANFVVLRKTAMPATLIEMAFITNFKDSEILKYKQYELAKAIANGIFKFLGMDIEPIINGPDYADHWANEYINEVIAEGIMTTDENGNFRPDDYVTRAEMSVISSRLLSKM